MYFGSYTFKSEKVSVPLKHSKVHIVSHVLSGMLALLLVLMAAGFTYAVEPVSVSKDLKAIDISNTGDWYRDVEGSLKVSTAPDPDGIVRRVEIRPQNSEGQSNWYVFALANDSSEQIDRLIVAPHYRMVKAGIIWPDLDSNRITAITPSEGFSLEAQEDREADVFLITLNPGAVITLIAELKTDKLPRLVLWEPSSYKDTVNSLTLYRGIVLGIAGLLAMFLTILFVVKGTSIFPATSALAWSVLAYVCVDFGFWDRVVSITQSSEPIWRAGAEVFLAISLLLFAYAYLRLNRWHRNYTFVVIGWMLALFALLGVVLFDPQTAAGLARLSFASTVGIAGIVIVHLALKRDDRAIMLIPIWLLTIAWVGGCWLTVTGRLSNDIIQPALGGGLVLIVLLIAFTILQNAFSGGALAQGLVSDAERQALALIGSGDIMWEWETSRDNIIAGPALAEALGISQSQINGPLQKMRNLIHPNDRERFQSTLESILEHKRGRISQSFRICGDDGHYHWFRLKARPMLGVSGDVMRCIGTMSDITDAKNAEIRLLQDAVRDNLTGLENRELFQNRLDMVMQMASRHIAVRPSVFHINIDEFRNFNTKVGYAVGDTILLTVARRVSRLLGSGDTIARLGGDQFAIMLLSESEPDRIASFADTIRKTLRAPIDFSGKEIKLTASIGIASWTADQTRPEQLMRDAELASLHAKRLGGNRIEPFRPAFRTGKDDSTILVDDLKIALENNQITVVYQPIVNLRSRATVGFEALVRWQHPKLGSISPADFIPIAERSGMINQLGIHVLNTAISDFTQLYTSHDDFKPFVSVNVSSRELLQEDFVKDIEKVLVAANFDPADLKLEITETMVMENPEYSAQVLARLKKLGIGLSLDDFGTGYSSLAYLMRFPFDTIKIDSSFVQARERKERLVVLRSIIAMAHGLEQSLVAEGVENETDVTELNQLGCECAQGYYFGEPMAARDIRKLIANEMRMAGQ